MKGDYINEIIDLGEADGAVLVKDETSDKLVQRSISYLVVFLGTIYLYQKSFMGWPVLSSRFLTGFIFSLSMPIMIATIFEFFRKWRRKGKEKKTGIKVLKNAMWFEIVESAFATYLLFMIVFFAFFLFAR